MFQLPFSASAFLQLQAWYRRGKANASLKNYEAAISDLEISLSIEGSSSGKRQIKEELDVISNHFNGTTEKTRLRNNAKQNKAADLGLSFPCNISN